MIGYFFEFSKKVSEVFLLGGSYSRIIYDIILYCYEFDLIVLC